jgi:hypothetical protein
VELKPVKQRSYWRVEMTWQQRSPRYFGKFDTQEEAEKWIAEHRWLTKKSQRPKEQSAQEP